VTRILIVESDTPEIIAASHRRGEMSYGEVFACVLTEIDPNVEPEIVAPYEGEDAVLEGVAGAVFTGSAVEWNTSDARAKPLASAMEQVFAAGIPTWGSCNGLQLAASVLGGVVGEEPKGREDGLAVGLEVVAEHPMVAGRESGFAVPCIHRDVVLEMPDGAELIVSNAHTRVQGMVYEQGNVRFWGTQYHPELSHLRLAGVLARVGLRDARYRADLLHADSEAAAERLGARASDLAFDTRTLELKNWLAQV